jgi:hypothetical protein
VKKSLFLGEKKVIPTFFPTSLSNVSVSGPALWWRNVSNPEFDAVFARPPRDQFWIKRIASFFSRFFICVYLSHKYFWVRQYFENFESPARLTSPNFGEVKVSRRHPEHRGKLIAA